MASFLRFQPLWNNRNLPCFWSASSTSENPSVVYNNHCINGLSSRHLVAISYEADLPIIAKADHIKNSDLLLFRGDNSSVANVGNNNQFLNKSRYVAGANAGPHVEAQVFSDLPTEADDYPAVNALPSDGNSKITSPNDLSRLSTCFAPTGDLFQETQFLVTLYTRLGLHMLHIVQV